MRPDADNLHNIIIKNHPENTPDLICKEALEVFASDTAYYTVCDEDGNFEILSFTSLKGEDSRLYKECFLPVIDRWVIESRAPVFIPDVSKDPRFFSNKAQNLKGYSLLSFPVYSGEIIHGILTVHRTAGESFGTGSISRIHAFARRAGELLRQSLTGRKETARSLKAEIFSEISEAVINSPDKKNLLEKIENIIKARIKPAYYNLVIFSVPSEVHRLPARTQKAFYYGKPILIKADSEGKFYICPLMHNGEVYGYMELQGKDDSCNYADMLETVAGLISLKLGFFTLSENFKEKRCKIKALEMIADYESSDDLSYAADTGKVIKATLNMIVDLLGVERANVMTYNEETGALTVRYYTGIDDRLFGRQTLGPGEGLAGYALKTGKPQQKNQATDPFFIESPEGQLEIKSLLAYPLISSGKKIGVINVGSVYSDRIFTEEEIAQIALIADRASLVIENSLLREQLVKKTEETADEIRKLKLKTEELTVKVKQLSRQNRKIKSLTEKLEKYKKQLSLLYGLTLDLFCSTDIKLVFERVVSCVREYLSKTPTVLAAAEVDENLGRFIIRASINLPGRYKKLLEMSTYDIPAPISDIMIKEKKPLIAPEVKKHSFFSKHKEARSLGSIYYFPVIIDNGTCAFLLIADIKEKLLKEDDLSFINAVTAQCSIALGGVKYYNELKLRSDKLARLNNLTEEICLIEDWDAQLDMILTMLTELLEHRNAALMLYDDSGALRVRTRSEESLLFENYLKDHSVQKQIGELIQRKLIYYSASDYESVAERYSVLKEAGINSFVILPLVTKEHKLGAILLGDESRKIHTKRMLEMYRMIAMRVALTIENARLLAGLTLEKDRMESVIESMSQGVVSLNWDRRITNFNRAAEEITGWKASDVIGKPCNLVFTCIESPDGNCIRICPLIDILAGSTKNVKGKRMEGRIKKAGGDLRDVSITMSLLKKEKEPVGAVLVFHDITEEKAFQNRRSDYLAAISHDIFTPLTAIKGYVTTLLTHKDYFDENTRIELIKIVNSEIDRITRLLYNLMSLSRMETDRLHSIPAPRKLHKSIEKIADLYSLNSKHHRIVLDSGLSSLPDVYADSDHVEQILNNLISNAIKYSPGGGDIEISARPRDGFIEVTVRDHGIGIEERNLERIFDRYLRIIKKESRSVSGMGLGLYITRALVELQGGKIHAENCPDGGSRFIFTLPIAREEHYSSPAKS